MRGLAAVVMLQGHVFHSFTSNTYRNGSAYTLSQFFGGMPPAFFLFLTGITLAFLMDSSDKKGLTPLAKWKTALRRSSYLFLLAYLFRLQLWLFAFPKSPWTDLWKVDILNAMGLGLTAMSVLAFFTTAERVRWGVVIGLGIACASPLISGLDWSGQPALLKMYLVPDVNYFSFFPWASFVAFGVSAGSLLRIIPSDQTEHLMQWLAVLGFGLILTAHYFSGIPFSLYESSDFWLDGPMLTLIKLGVILVTMAWGFVWNEYVLKDRWNWLRQIGTTSLLIYWVHIELVYGRWFWMWKENLTVGHTLVITVLVILLMLGLSVGRTRWKQLRAWVGASGRVPQASSLRSGS